ncbi:TolC family protein [candidate division KSB1 bacterium]|nr:TolC family protein [candidate division KSB1 bacterium]
MLKQFLMIIMLSSLATAFGQTNLLENYIQEGLKNNLALKQQAFSFQKSMKALQQARGMFLPSFGIEARYSRAGGGRMIEMPIGDLVNPVYQTLNQILAMTGQPARFPENIPNQTIPFLREEEQETKIRVIQPLFQPALYFNYKLKSNLKEIKQIEMEIFKRHLIADIKKAYFQYLQTGKVTQIYEKTTELLEENLRVSQSLFINQQATEEVVFQARAELADLEQKRMEAEKNKKLAAAYFNFLLNRSLDSPIDLIDDQIFRISHELDNLEQVENSALERRLEFEQLRQGIEAARQGVRLATTSYLPGITGVFDYGVQGEKYRFTEKDDYWMGSVVLQWNIFRGFQDQAQRSQAKIEMASLETQQIELNQKIKLEIKAAYDNLTVCHQAVIAAAEQRTSAQKSFRIVHKKYQEGMAPQIEFIHARTLLTNAEINFAISQYDYHIKYAEFERVTGL